MTLLEIAKKYGVGTVFYEPGETPLHTITEIKYNGAYCTTPKNKKPFYVVFLDKFNKYEVCDAPQKND